MLNYRYRLMPTEAQAEALIASMRLIRWGWNLAVRREKWARRMIRAGRAAQLHKTLAELAAQKKPVGRRAPKLAALMKEGRSESEALAKLNADDIRKAWTRKRSGLSVEYAAETTNAAKQSMMGSRLGSAWAKLISNKGKFFVAWQACWKGIREAPRKDKDYMRGWLCMQIQGSNPIVPDRVNGHGDRYVNLSALMPGAADTEVRFLQHRPLPPDAQINELKVTRQRDVWFVVITVTNEVPKDYAATGLTCGIDPGVTTPCTLAGDDTPLGVDAVEYGPGRPLTKALKKLRRLQRKLDRQRRANNPACFRADGTWIKGKRMTTISKGMHATEDRIAQVHARCADIRKDAWNQAADKILAKYDTVYLGNWKDGTPEQKGKRRDKRKQAFAETGEKRAKGEAARQTTHERVNRDNALGIFRQTLEEKARRSKTPKTVILVSERNTTRGCARCGALAGPTGLKGLSRRKWTCPECGFKQKRDCSAAWNILQAGKQQQAGGQPVTGGRNPSVAGGSQGLSGSVPGIEQTTASGQVVNSSGGALARRQPTVSQGDGDIRKRGPSKRKRAGPPPLAEGSASSRKDSP